VIAAAAVAAEESVNAPQHGSKREAKRAARAAAHAAATSITATAAAADTSATSAVTAAATAGTAAAAADTTADTTADITADTAATAEGTDDSAAIAEQEALAREVALALAEERNADENLLKTGRVVWIKQSSHPWYAGIVWTVLEDCVGVCFLDNGGTFDYIPMKE
jgi:hypothetical protein